MTVASADLRGLVAALVLVLGCNRAEPEPSSTSATSEAVVAPAEAPVALAPRLVPDESDLPPPRESPAELEALRAAAGSEESGAETDDANAAEAPSEPEQPADPLAPILPAGPAGPEPGSPEADAELAELLEDSTLTQDEFDKAFRGGAGPKVRDDQLVFGGGRKQPVVTIGTPKLVDGKLDTSKLRASAQADERKLIGCYTMALANDPKQHGSVTLRLRFDDERTDVQANAGASLGAPLIACLETAARGWQMPGAAKATVELPLTLSTQ